MDRPDVIDGTLSPPVFKKYTFKIVAREPFPNGEPVVFPMEIPADEINGVHAQEIADSKYFRLV